MNTDAKRESAWVIERYLHSVLYYWTGQVFGKDSGNHTYFDRTALDSGFATDPNNALRFARAEDATIILARFLEGNGRVAEHVWGLS